MPNRLSLVRTAFRPKAARRCTDPPDLQIADALPDPCWLYDLQAGRFVHVNAAFRRCWGGDGADGGLSVGHWLARVHADDRAPVQAALERLADGGGYALEYRALDRCGATRWIAEDARCVDAAPGETRHVFGIARDISARKAREEALQDELRRKDELLAVLMHELRTPLQAISAAGATLPASHAAAARIIGRQVQHMARLVDDLGEATRIAHHRVHLQFEDVDLRGVLREAIAALQAGADGRQPALQLHAPDDEVRVRADPARLLQVFGNLLHNALKFSPAGSCVQVWIAPDRAAGEVTVSVVDEGAGIAPDALDSVFGLFVQEPSAPTRLRGGLGIGLAVVRQLVELHGGQVSAHSAGRGRGSRFDVTLPAQAPPAARR